MSELERSLERSLLSRRFSSSPADRGGGAKGERWGETHANRVPEAVPSHPQYQLHTVEQVDRRGGPNAARGCQGVSEGGGGSQGGRRQRRILVAHGVLCFGAGRVRFRWDVDCCSLAILVLSSYPAWVNVLVARSA